MSQEQTPSRGTVTVGAGTSEPRSIEIVDYLSADYVNHRLISVVGLEDGSYVLSVENPYSTGRAPKNSMWLSQESMLGLLATMHLYLSAKKFDLEQHIKEAAGRERIEYDFSDNLTPAFEGQNPESSADATPSE